jgi:hypothetical protein
MSAKRDADAREAQQTCVRSTRSAAKAHAKHGRTDRESETTLSPSMIFPRASDAPSAGARLSLVTSPFLSRSRHGAAPAFFRNSFAQLHSVTKRRNGFQPTLRFQLRVRCQRLQSGNFKSMVYEGPLKLATEHMVAILMPDALDNGASAGEKKASQTLFHVLALPSMVMDRVHGWNALQADQRSSR